MFHSRTLNNRINKLRERALRLVYKDSKLTFEQLTVVKNMQNSPHWVYSLISQGNHMRTFTFWQEQQMA